MVSLEAVSAIKKSSPFYFSKEENEKRRRERTKTIHWLTAGFYLEYFFYAFSFTFHRAARAREKGDEMEVV